MPTLPRWLCCLLLLPLALTHGCGDEASSADHTEAGTTTGDVAGGTIPAPEASSGTDAPSAASDTATPWSPAFCTVEDVIAAWPLNDAVSGEGASIVLEDGVHTAVIEATAGGFANQAQRPFVYVDLERGEVLELTDIEALQDRRWHIALKRVLFRINGGDSGPGEMRMTRLTDTSLDTDLTIAPDAFWATDRHFDAECHVGTDPIGNPFTAMNALNLDSPTGTQSWYERGDTMTFDPVPDVVYVLETPDGAARFALVIEAWESGTYTLRWRQLPS